MEDYLQNSRYQMSHITKFQTDVTDNYTATEDLAIPVRNKVKLADSEFVHLGIFDNKEWRPIDFGVLKKGKAHFHTIGRDAVYIVLGYDAEKLIPISDPFILHAKGNIEYCIPDTSHLKQVSLTRK